MGYQIFVIKKCFKNMRFVIMNRKHQAPNEICVDIDTCQALKLIK